MNPLNVLVEQVMIPFLEFSYSHIYPNYGVAIIILTLSIKALFYPLTKKQFESMKQMQVLQPKIKEINEKHKGKPEQLQKEMMGLYKDHGFNPLSGCLPLLVQLPVFFAIFMTVNGPIFKGIIAQPGINPGLFTWWLSDLSKPDFINIFGHNLPGFLPIIIGVATYWSQKYSVTDPMQQKIFMFLPLIIVVFSFKLPAGVLLYWATSQIVSTLQQVMMLRQPAAKGV